MVNLMLIIETVETIRVLADKSTNVILPPFHSTRNVRITRGLRIWGQIMEIHLLPLSLV
jgi:hypothetical protein